MGRRLAQRERLSGFGEKRVEKGNYIYFYIIERKENYGKKICFWRAI